MGGVGMLGVGVLGGALLGNIQDQTIDRQLKRDNAALHAKVTAEPRPSLFGTYQAIDAKRLELVSPEDKAIVKGIQDGAKKDGSVLDIGYVSGCLPDLHVPLLHHPDSVLQGPWWIQGRTAANGTAGRTPLTDVSYLHTWPMAFAVGLVHSPPSGP